MGFDNECILNIQSLAGEYFCPVCRTLVYPHEALQAQCTHLYCKPCLAYVVSSTQACPYDGYLVTEAGSKPLMESNKALAETIGKTSVHCLYHRSGCVWQGPLSECTSHCSGCAFGNSPVVCNRCGIQIVHRQVQEHAQTCNVNGTSTQPQQGSETAQDAAASGGGVTNDQSKVAANQAAAAAAAVSQPQASNAATGPSTTQNLNQPATANPVPQATPATAAPTSEQWYQQQYYQQYPGYDPYQQQQAYQQYYPYQQQPQNQPLPQSQPPMPLQPQVQPQPQAQPPPQMHSQPQPQIPSSAQPQPLYPQAPVVGSSQNQSQMNPQQQAHMPPQSYPQTHAPPHMQVPQYQQPHPHTHHSQPPQPQPHPHFQPHPQPQSQPINPQYPPVQPYPTQYAPPQQHPMHVQPPPAQFPPPTPHMRPPPLPHMGMPPPPQQHIYPHNQPPHQRPMHQPMPPQYVQQPHHAGPYAPQHSQVRPPQPMQQPPVGYVQPQQQGTAVPHGMPPQSYVGRTPMLNQGGQPPQFPPSSGAPPHTGPPQFGSLNQSNVNMTSQPQAYSEQQPNQYGPGDQTSVEQQQDKKPDLVTNDSGANFNQVKTETGVNDERKPGNGGEDESLAKDAVSQVQGVPSDSVTPQRVKEESKDGFLNHSPGVKPSQDGGVATIDSGKQGEAGLNLHEADNGSLAHIQQGQYSQSQTMPQAQIGTEQSPHPPPMPYASSGQQQRPDAPPPPSHLRPPGPGYTPHGPHPGDQFQPPEFSNNRQSHGQYNQGQRREPPLPHGPMETDMYQNQRPSHFDTRRPDSHYGPPPFGAESNPMRMNGAPPPGLDSSSAPVFRDEKFRSHPDAYSEFKGTLKQFPDSPKFGSRPLSGYGMDGPSRFLDKDPHGYYESGGRLSMHDDNRGRFDKNPDFLGPMHGFGRHHMDRLPPGSPPRPYGGPHGIDDMERHPFGERFPGHMHRGEFEKPPRGEPFGLRNRPHVGEPGFGSYGRSGESFGESFGNRPHLSEPGFRSSYSRHGFPSDGGFYAGGPDSFDPFRKRNTMSMGWCRICKVDCESVEGLDMHGQTREHQRMAMDMVISIKQKNAKKQKTSNDHSARDEGSKLRNTEIHARVNIS